MDPRAVLSVIKHPGKIATPWVFTLGTYATLAGTTHDSGTRVQRHLTPATLGNTTTMMVMRRTKEGARVFDHLVSVTTTGAIAMRLLPKQCLNSCEVSRPWPFAPRGPFISVFHPVPKVEILLQLLEDGDWFASKVIGWTSDI